MTAQKPIGISDRDWQRTPPAVQNVLAQSIKHIQILQMQQTAGDATLATSPPLDAFDDEEEGVTMFMPDASAGDEEEGATMFMPDPAAGEDGATAFMPDPAAEEDGATAFMPDPAAEEDGATAFMPDPAAEEGATAFMPDPAAAEDGATAFMPDPAAEEDGATAFMPDPAAEEGATAFMPDPAAGEDGATAFMPDPAAEEGATAFMPDPAAGEDGGTVAMPPAPGKRRTRQQASKKTKPSPAKATIRHEHNLWDQKIILQERYRLRKILGKGGFGAAYLAEDIKLKRGCVVKQMLSPEGTSARELEMNRANFEREASLLVQLNHPGHPNIPEIFDYFSDDSGSYLVMKYIEGQSLKGLMRQKDDKILWDEAVRYAIDICSALSYMHTHGEEPVLHRDIKPDNVLLGDDGRIWLVDFGLAQAKAVENTDELSSRGNAAGSVGYTPFEQWLGESIPASDVYATGVTLHHLVTGESPIEGYRETDGNLKVNIEKLRDLHGQLDPIRKINRKLPRELEDIIKQATAPEPDQRVTALQLKQQLEVLISGAGDAALFTFKDGQSANTIPELVDLCETHRVEAQGYLYRGDFERWFTLINRNDLAGAAAQAVKHSQKGKDGLEKFLKLIMPNIFLRRLWKASKKVSRVGVQLLLVVALALIIVVVLGTMGMRWLLRQTIANYNWNYYALELDEPNTFSDAYLTENAQSIAEVYLDNVEIDPQSPNRVDINASVGSLAFLNIPVELAMVNNRPQMSIHQINGQSLYWLGDNITTGINQGIAEALQNAPIDITAIEVNDQAVVVDVERSGRTAWNPPTPVPQALATATATPLPTATPPGEALLAIFNELDREISIEIEGQQWRIPAQDTKVIEQEPGTYSYTVRYSENGQLAAQGTRTWTYRAYKWRIGLDGETFE